MNKYIAGAMAGFAATAPMTGVMFLLHNQLPWSEKHPLPPEDITKELAARAGAPHLNHTNHQMATWVAHFGFGAGTGLLYGALTEKVKAHPALKGVLFGLLVWSTSYLGWLPGTGIFAQPKDQPTRLNWLMIMAHIVWGATLGLLTEQATKE